MRFYQEKGVAYCGLACALCSKEDCPGCAARGCPSGGCSVFQCVAGKGLDGCYACDDYPCGERMHSGIRNRAFNRYARRYGKAALLARLFRNHSSGIVYHRPGGLKGDYDELATEDAIYRLVAYGSHDPYAACPVLEAGRFTLRLVTPDDAVDLLACYGDPKAQPLFNADRCTSDFRYQTLNEMRECIAFFLACYKRRHFVRFAIVDNDTAKAVGTAEMFGGDMVGGFGVLRLDLASPYETEETLSALLAAAIPPFFDLFYVRRILTKAIPEAQNRVKCLKAVGFKPHVWPEPGREHYWALENEG